MRVVTPLVGLLILSTSALAQNAPRPMPPPPMGEGDTLRLPGVFPEQRFAFTPPIGWASTKTIRDGMLANYTAPNTDGATLSVAYAEEPGRSRLPDNLPKLFSESLAKRYPGFKQTAQARQTVHGADSWRFDGELKATGMAVVIRNRQIYLCRDGRIYIFTLTCKKDDYARLLPSLERMVASLRWLDTPK